VHTISGYEWDSIKAATNRLKHGIDFSDAVAVFGDEFAVTIEDASGSEQRFVTLGASATGEILVVVYTWRGAKIRIISAREAIPRERQAYEAQNHERHERRVRLHPWRARSD